MNRAADSARFGAQDPSDIAHNASRQGAERFGLCARTGRGGRLEVEDVEVLCDTAGLLDVRLGRAHERDEVWCVERPPPVPRRHSLASGPLAQPDAASGVVSRAQVTLDDLAGDRAGYCVGEFIPARPFERGQTGEAVGIEVF